MPPPSCLYVFAVLNSEGHRGPAAAIQIPKLWNSRFVVIFSPFGALSSTTNPLTSDLFCVATPVGQVFILHAGLDATLWTTSWHGHLLQPSGSPCHRPLPNMKSGYDLSCKTNTFISFFNRETYQGIVHQKIKPLPRKACPSLFENSEPGAAPSAALHTSHGKKI